MEVVDINYAGEFLAGDTVGIGIRGISAVPTASSCGCLRGTCSPELTSPHGAAMCRTTSRRASAMAPLWPVKDEAPGLLHGPFSKSHARPCGRLAPPSRAGAVATRDIRNAQVLPASPCALWGGRAPAHHLSQSERDLSGGMRGAVEVSVAVGVPGISIEGHKGVTHGLTLSHRRVTGAW